MILQQHYLACLAQASYLLGDEATKTAIVVDPRRDVELYLDEAKRLGLAIRHVILTHFHADFLAGHLELRARTGAEICLGRRAQAEFPFRKLAEGDAIEAGTLRVEVLETPGHTPEGISLVVYDLAKSRKLPHAVLTGDTLFIGDVGRPDLLASIGVSEADLAGMLYDSLHQKLMKLPDETLLYPGHGAGSSCGRSLSKETVCTIGRQRASNYALQAKSRAEFVALVTEPRPAPPAYFGFDAQLNREEHATLDESLARALEPLSLDELLARKQAGACVLDSRSADAWAAGHLHGSLNIGLGGKYAHWAGTLIPSGCEIVLVADPGKQHEAAMRLGRIGFDSVSGYLEGGAAAFAARPDLLARATRIDAAELARRLAAADAPVVLDVRAPDEVEAGHIEGALTIPLPELEARVAEVPRGRQLVLQCGSGYRSTIAASLLEADGFTGLTDLIGGFGAWKAAELPVVVPARLG